MMVQKLFLWLMFVVGGFIVFKVSPIAIINEMEDLFTSRHVTLKNKVKLYKKKKKRKGVVDVIVTAKDTLAHSYSLHLYPIYCLLSAIGFFIGLVIGAMLENRAASIVIALGLAYTPFLVIRYLSYNNQYELNSALKSALSNIRGTYLNNDNYIFAIKDNLLSMRNPVKEVYEELINEVENFNVPIVQAIKNSRGKINNDIWKEWCDTTIICQDNKDFRGALTPITNKLADVQLTNEEFRMDMSTPLKNTIIIDTVLILMPVLFYFIAHDWYVQFMTNPIGKGIFAVDLIAFFVIAHGAVVNSKPIEYKR